MGYPIKYTLVGVHKAEIHFWLSQRYVRQGFTVALEHSSALCGADFFWEFSIISALCDRVFFGNFRYSLAL